MSGDYLWDRSGPPDPEIQRLERLLGQYGYRKQTAARPLWRAPRVLVPLAMAAALVLAFGIWNASRQGPGLSWDVRPLVGTPTVDAEAIGPNTSLQTGGWLETNAISRAEIFVANIGIVEVESNTRVELTGDRASGYRLKLSHGTVHATINETDAGFVIETAAARAVDLGADYYLSVNNDGGASLCVISGSVALESDDRRSIVPAGAVCQTKPKIGPGTPHCEHAPEEFSDALERFDFGGFSSDALTAVLTQAGPCDLIPLWHLLRRVDAGERGRVYDCMAAFAAPPAGVTRDGILDLDQGMLQFWWSDIKSHQTCMLCQDDQMDTSS
jgi:hypothetical protein